MESSTLRKERFTETRIRRNANSPFLVFPNAINLIRKLNIDIPAGVLCSSLFAAKLYNINLSPYYFIILFLTVWIIYSTDDIIDGIKSRKNFYNNEYQFHYKNRRILIPLTILATSVCGYLSLTYLDSKLIIFGLCMILFVSVYFVLNAIFKNKKGLYFKEIMIALIYTTGIFGGIWVLKGHTGAFQSLIVCNFLFIAFSNVLLFSLFDLEKDRYLNFNNLAKQIGINRVNKILIVVLTFSPILSIFTGIYFEQWNYPLILVLMTTFLSIISYKKTYFKNHKYYGVITDSVFVLPILSIWL